MQISLLVAFWPGIDCTRGVTEARAVTLFPSRQGLATATARCPPCLGSLPDSVWTQSMSSPMRTGRYRVRTRMYSTYNPCPCPGHQLRPRCMGAQKGLTGLRGMSASRLCALSFVLTKQDDCSDRGGSMAPHGHVVTELEAGLTTTTHLGKLERPHGATSPY